MALYLPEVCAQHLHYWPRTTQRIRVWNRQDTFLELLVGTGSGEKKQEMRKQCWSEHTMWNWINLESLGPPSSHESLVYRLPLLVRRVQLLPVVLTIISTTQNSMSVLTSSRSPYNVLVLHTNSMQCVMWCGVTAYQFSARLCYLYGIKRGCFLMNVRAPTSFSST